MSRCLSASCGAGVNHCQTLQNFWPKQCAYIRRACSNTMSICLILDSFGWFLHIGATVYAACPADAFVLQMVKPAAGSGVTAVPSHAHAVHQASVPLNAYGISCWLGNDYELLAGVLRVQGEHRAGRSRELVLMVPVAQGMQGNGPQPVRPDGAVAETAWRARQAHPPPAASTEPRLAASSSTARPITTCGMRSRGKPPCVIPDRVILTAWKLITRRRNR